MAASCEICGARVGVMASLCPNCASKYSVSACEECDTRMVKLGQPTALCSRCVAVDVADRLPEEIWQRIDPLVFGNQILAAMTILRDEAELSLNDSQSVFGSRYDKLRRDCPDGFSCAHDEYWEGFYS